MISKNRIRLIIMGIFVLWLVLLTPSFAQNISLEEYRQSIRITNPEPDFSLRIRTDRRGEHELSPGEKMILSFQTNQNSYITIFQYRPEGEVQILFPRNPNQYSLLQAGQLYQSEIKITPEDKPGIGYVQGFASTRPVLLQDSELDLLSSEVPVISSHFRMFTDELLNRLRRIPQSEWVTSEMIEYRVKNPNYSHGNTGSIMAISFPQGAEVYINGLFQGVTPKRIENFSTGQHTIEFIMPGYNLWSKDITVSHDRITRIEADLEKKEFYGKLLVSSDPSNTVVFVDGKEYGKVPINGTLLIGQLKEGFHELTVMKPESREYKTWVQMIEVISGETTSVHVSLILQK